MLLGLQGGKGITDLIHDPASVAVILLSAFGVTHMHKYCKHISALSLSLKTRSQTHNTIY